MVIPTDPALGLTVTVPAAIGYPPVFYQQGSVAGEALRAFLIERGYTEGYQWDYPPSQGPSSEVGATAGIAVKGGDSQDAVPFAMLLTGVVVVLVAVAWLYHLRARSIGKPQYVDGDNQDATERLLSATEASDASL